VQPLASSAGAAVTAAARARMVAKKVFILLDDGEMVEFWY
jgi:hypothetical protein